MAQNHELVEELTNGEFEEFTKKGVVLVDFFAEWCLSPGTKLTLNPCIANIETVSKGSKVLSFDKNFNESFANVKSTFNIVHNQKIDLTTERGRKVSCTPEHLIHTNKGFCKAKKISNKHLLSIYPTNSYPEIEDNKNFVIIEKDLRKVGEKLKLNKERYFNELKEKGLIDIKYNEEKTYVLASLLGFLLTDGSLSLQKNNERSTEFFVGDKGGSEEVLKDLKFLGYSGEVRKQKIVGEINGRKFTQNIIRIRNSRTSLFLLLKSIGAVEGKKFFKGVTIPKWIINGPKEIQRVFLQGFLGGDGTRCVIRVVKRKKGKSYNKPTINDIEFHFASKKLAEILSKDLKKALTNFGVEIGKIVIKKEERYVRKDKKDSFLLKIGIKDNLKSAYNYCSIGFKYDNNKKLISAISKEYLRERLVNPKTEIVDYNKWIKKYSRGNLLFDKVKEVRKISGGKYPFISLSLDNDTKTFVANDIVHHNCMPCLIMSPVIDELAEKFKGKARFGKVNVEDAPQLANKFNVSSIPNIFLLKNGKVVKQFIGSVSSEELEGKIKEYL